MSGSFDVAGLRVDYGSHRLHPSTPPHLLNRISSLLGDDLQTRERNGRIRLYDRWVSFPLRTTNMIRHLPLSFSFNSGLDILQRPFTKRSDLHSMMKLRIVWGEQLLQSSTARMQKSFGVFQLTS
ncbi:MAG: hypothetical protein CM15mP49_23670 [Actinomycetota bacterium]|nr:MAG: hypothetical protein CM15mP49_23670 [Actinomycetota bacterium]